MLDLIKLICCILVSFLIWYVIGSVIAWDYNPAEWWVLGRIFYIIFSFKVGIYLYDELK